MGAFDHAALLSCANGDLDLAHELADIFSPPPQPCWRKSAARSQGPTAVRWNGSAHSMKSAISFLPTPPAWLRPRLEHMGCTGELTSADTVAAALEHNVESRRGARDVQKESAS
jgi:hypothetical protein